MALSTRHLQVRQVSPAPFLLPAPATTGTNSYAGAGAVAAPPGTVLTPRVLFTPV